MPRPSQPSVADSRRYLALMRAPRPGPVPDSAPFLDMARSLLGPAGRGGDAARDAARACLDRALEYDPCHPVVLEERIGLEVLAQGDRLDRFLAVRDRLALSVMPRKARTMAGSLARQGRLDTALDCLFPVAEADACDPASLGLAADLACVLDRGRAGAVLGLLKAKTGAPGNAGPGRADPLAWYLALQTGRLALALGDAAGAAPDLEASLEAAPTARAHRLLAAALRRLGHSRGAALALAASLSLDPHQPGALADLAGLVGLEPAPPHVQAGALAERLELPGLVRAWSGGRGETGPETGA